MLIAAALRPEPRAEIAKNARALSDSIHRIRLHRRGGGSGGNGRFTRELRRKQAKARLERYGIDVAGDAAVVANERRLMRNARKRERQVAHG